MATYTTHTGQNENALSVGLGEVKVSSDSAISLVCFGLGSCVSVCAYDPAVKVAGMAHIVLPERIRDAQDAAATKFADVAVAALLKMMNNGGAVQSRLVVKLAGGSQMIQIEGFPDILEMGSRNIESTKKLLKAFGVPVAAEDVGGNYGRSVWFSVATGAVTVRTAGRGIKQL